MSTQNFSFSLSVTGKSRILPRSSHLSLPPQCQQQWLASSLSVPPSTKRRVTKGTQITETTAVREKAAASGCEVKTLPLHVVIGGLNVKSKVSYFFGQFLLLCFCYKMSNEKSFDVI